jgi:hypothetical protein
LIIWLIFFLFLQTKPSFAACLPSPRTVLFCVPVSISAVSLGRLSTYIHTFRFSGCSMGSFLSDTFFKSFSSAVNMFISIFMIQIYIAEFLVMSAEITCWEKEKKGKFLMRTFTCRSTFLYMAKSNPRSRPPPSLP